MRIQKDDSGLLEHIFEFFVDMAEGEKLREITPSTGNPKELWVYREITSIAKKKNINPIPKFYVASASEGRHTIPGATALKIDKGKHSPSAVLVSEGLLKEGTKPEITATLEHELTHIERGHLDKVIGMQEQGLLHDNISSAELHKMNSLRRRWELEADEGVSNPKALVSIIKKGKSSLHEQIKEGFRRFGYPEREAEKMASGRTASEAHPSHYRRFSKALTRQREEPEERHK